MKNIIKITSDQLERLYEAKEELKLHLSASKKLRPFIFKQVSKHMTSLGNNDAFPPEEDYPFDYKILKERFSDITDRILELNGLESLDEDYLSTTLSELIKQCRELEEPIRANLEKICTNVILRLFDVPTSTINFEGDIVDEIKPEHQFRIKPAISSKRKFDFESIDDFNNANKSVLKRRLINSLIQGASYTYATNKDLYLTDVYPINSELVELYDKITIINDYLLFTKEENITDKNPMQGGCVEVSLGSKGEKSTIHAQGIIFPFLLTEMIRGFFELFASHGLPSDDEKAKYIINQADFLIAEPWDLRMGVNLWKLISEQIEDTNILPYFFSELCSLPTEEFNFTLQEVFAHTNKGQHIIVHMIDNAREEINNLGFVPMMKAKNASEALIIDDIYSNDEINNMLGEAKTFGYQDIFEYPDGALYKCTDYAEITNLLYPILGEHDNQGSSRLVYDLDDYQVIKIAYGGLFDEGKAGLSQNENEKNILQHYSNYSIFPKFFYGDEINKWIVVEKVVPATKEDFVKVLHMPFDTKTSWAQDVTRDKLEYYTRDDVYGINTELTFTEFLSWAWHMNGNKDFKPRYRKYIEAMNSNPLLEEFYSIITNRELMLADLVSIRNYGMVMRNGKAAIVILDAGLTDELYNKLYS